MNSWGYVFMMTGWIQSAMVSAIAARKNPDSRSREYLNRRNELIGKSLPKTWAEFKKTFPTDDISEGEEHQVKIMYVIRNLLAHVHISTGRGFGLLKPKAGKGSTEEAVKELVEAVWIEEPADSSGFLILRENDVSWYEKNIEMITQFAETTITRMARKHGVGQNQFF